MNQHIIQNYLLFINLTEIETRIDADKINNNIENNNNASAIVTPENNTGVYPQAVLTSKRNGIHLSMANHTGNPKITTIQGTIQPLFGSTSL